MSKLFDMSSLAAEVSKDFKDKPHIASRVSSGDKLKKLGPDDFLKMPKWWQEATNMPGLPYGAGVQLAGKTDCGKTSAAIVAMKCALDQKHAVLYVETENKTTEQDLINRGIDPEQIFLIRTTISENAFDLLFAAWDKIETRYPGVPILIVWDSFGNMVSQRDMDLTMSDGKQKPGGKGAANRLGLNKFIARFEQSTKVSLLLINYVYANIGAPGSQNAGGVALGQLSSLIYQCSRKGWLTKTVKGKKIRIGAQVKWALNKNHVFKDNPGPMEVILNITGAGIEYIGGSSSSSSDQEEGDEE